MLFVAQRRTTVVFAVVGILAAAACSDRRLPTEPGKPITAFRTDSGAALPHDDGCWGTITPESPSIFVGEAVDMYVEFFCTDGSYAVNPFGTEWFSTNQNVVSLSADGYGGVWANGVGQGVAQVQASYGYIYAIAQVTVRAPPTLSSVDVTPSSAQVFAGQTIGLTATPRDQYGNVISGLVASWSSTNTSAATVASTGDLTANVTGVQAGQATIRATVNGVVGTSAITVPLNVYVSGPDMMSLHVYTTFTANSTGGWGSLNHQWRYRRRQSNGVWGEWNSWMDYGAQNTLSVAEHSCGIDSWELEAKVTDSVGNTNTGRRQVWISNPC
jgi:hypothetical protein